MSERRKKAPKIAWRDLMKTGAETPSAEQPAARPAEQPPEAPAPTPAAEPSTEPSAEASTVRPARAPRRKATAPRPEAAASTTVQALEPSADAAESSPSALAAKLDEAYAALVAETAREEAMAAPATPAAPASAGGPPPDNNIAPAPAERVTVRARAASPAPAQPATPSSAPAATPEAEVQRILARLATYVPVPRVAPVAAETADVDSSAPVMPRGPMPLEQDVAPLVTPSGLRDAARTRRGRVELLLFRAGGELFALPLAAVEEAIEAPAIHSLPEMPESMLGVFNLRERLVPTYSPGASLGVAVAEPAGAALLVRSGERRLALAADDVEDVMELDLSTLRDPPVVEDTDGILLGVARSSRDLVGVLDADALIAACLGGRNVETP